MRDDAIALHLPKAQAAIPCAPLNRLPGQDLHWTPAARVDLVIPLQHTVMTAKITCWQYMRISSPYTGEEIDEEAHNVQQLGQI